PIGSRPSIEPSADERAKAMALVDRVIEARGGLDRLRAIKTIVVKQTLSTRAPQGESKYDTENYIQYPDRVRVVTEAPGGTIVQAFDGSRVWMVNPDGVHDAPEPLVREFRNNLRRDPVRLLIAAKDGGVVARLLPEQKGSDGATFIPIELSAPDLGP